VTPILKSGPKNNIANYRPIAKISNIAKLFERIVAHKLSFLVKTYISTSQTGFVAGRSTTTNLAVFSNYCINVFDMRSQVDAIYTDFANLRESKEWFACHTPANLKDTILFILNRFEFSSQQMYYSANEHGRNMVKFVELLSNQNDNDDFGFMDNFVIENQPIRMNYENIL